MGKNGTGGIRTYDLSHVPYGFSAWRQEREQQAWVSKPQSPVLSPSPSTQISSHVTRRGTLPEELPQWFILLDLLGKEKPEVT